MYHLSGPSDFEGNVSSTASKRERASGLVRSAGMGITLLVVGDMSVVVVLVAVVVKYMENGWEKSGLHRYEIA